MSHAFKIVRLKPDKISPADPVFGEFTNKPGRVVRHQSYNGKHASTENFSIVCFEIPDANGDKKARYIHMNDTSLEPWTDKMPSPEGIFSPYFEPARI